MKKLSIAMLSIFCCTQQIHSMELHTPPSDDKGYIIITKDLSELPKRIPISKEFNEFSEQLYKENITDAEIRKLVKNKGAVLNYQRNGSTWPLVFEYAYGNRVDNMRTVIELGAAIHNLEGNEHTPLTLALQHDKFLEKNLSDMIQLLVVYENPIVTQYEHEYYDKNGKWKSTSYGGSEEKTREFLIDHALCYPNIAIIKLLLEQKLMTANRGLKEFARFQKPNQDVLNLLITSGANNGEELLPQAIQKAFPSDDYIIFFTQLCNSKVFNKETLERMRTIKNNVDAIISLLESNEQQ